MSIATLSGLVSEAPAILRDSGKGAREAIALRCLEVFCGLEHGTNANRLSSRGLRIEFDLAESCENVLERIWHETSGFNLLKDVSDELKLDVRSFIEHKKSSLPRSTLDLLKNMIVEGTHPLAASLKEFSRLTLRYQCALTIPLGGGDPTSPPLVINENGHGNEAMVVEGHSDSKHGTVDKPLQANLSTIDENGHGNEAMVVEGHNDSEPRVVDKSVQANLSKGNFLHPKRDASHLCIDSYTLETDGASNDMKNHVPPGKKLKLHKQCVVQPKQQDPVSYGGSKRSNYAEAEQNHQLSKANGMHDGKPCQENFGDSAKTNVGNSDKALISPVNNESFPGKIDFQKKIAFLSSQCALDEDVLTMDDTEADLCMKCDTGGQLLICSASTCSLAFHESCLDCSAIFDEGKFYCPVCAYSRAISEYVKAKQKVSFARKELSLFIGGKSGCLPKHDSEGGLRDDVMQQRQNEDKSAEPENGADAATQADNLEFSSSKDKEQELPAPSFPTAREVSASAVPHISSEGRQGTETIIRLARDVTGMQNQGQGDQGSDGCKLSRGNEKITNANQECGKVEIKTKTHQDSELQKEACPESISNRDAPSENEKRKATSSLPFPTPSSMVPLSQWVRRKRMPWTAEEEAMLKKGVRELAQGDNKAIPWRNILEYGGSVFQKGRKAVDLKDKWRNILRSESFNGK